ncbi:MAG: hypothetical protein AAF902_18025, partial [Chloroflexota bacterium]
MSNSKIAKIVANFRPRVQTIWPKGAVMAQDSQSDPLPTPSEPMSTEAQQLTKPNSLFDRNQWPSWFLSAFSIFLATFVYYILAQSFSGEIFTSPLATIADSGTNPYLFGVAVQEMLLPLLLMVIFTTRPLFQTFVTDPSQSGRMRVALVFALIEMVYLIFVFNFGELWVTFGLFVIAAAGLIVGWRVGLAVGLMSFFMEGTFELLLSARDDWN